MATIVLLKSENVKRLKAIEVRPKKGGGLIVIGGRNRQGKSSLLDSVKYGLAGKGTLPEEPIRDGEEQAEIEIEFDDGTFVRRTINRTKTGGTFAVKPDRKSKPLKAGQSVLDDRLNAFSMDPLGFIGLGETTEGRREQGEIFLQLAKVDLSELDASRDEAYKARTDVNNDLKKVRARLDGMEYHGDVPAEETSIAELMGLAQTGREHNSKIDEIEGEVNYCNTEEKRTLEEIEQLRDQLADLETQHAKYCEEYAAAVKKLKASKRSDVEAIEKRIAEADEVNALVRSNTTYREVENEVEELESTEERLTGEIKEIDTEKDKRISGAKLPIKGLSINEEKHVTYKGIPLNQCAQSEQLWISIAMGAAMNPDMRIMLSSAGSFLDNDNLELLDKYADELKMQIWLEVVGGECQVCEGVGRPIDFDGPCQVCNGTGMDPRFSLIIEDGTVKEPKNES